MFCCFASICFEINTLFFGRLFLLGRGCSDSSMLKNHIREKMTCLGKSGSSYLTLKYLQNLARNKAFSTIIWCDQNYSVLKQNKILSIITARTCNYSKAYSILPFLLDWHHRDGLFGFTVGGVPTMLEQWYGSCHGFLWPVLWCHHYQKLWLNTKISTAPLFPQPSCLLCRKGNILPLQS